MVKGVMAKEVVRPGATTKVKEHLTLFRLPLDMVIVKDNNLLMDNNLKDLLDHHHLMDNNLLDLEKGCLRT